MRTLIAALIFCLAGWQAADAGPRYAQKNDGILLTGQSPVPLQDGLHVYLPSQHKMVPSERLFTKKESALLRKNAVEALNYHRYWDSGTPPEEPMQDRMMNAVKNAETKRGNTIRFIQDLQGENWFGFHPAPPGQAEGG